MRGTGRSARLGALGAALCLVLVVAPAGAVPPDDPYYGAGMQWGLERIEAERAWTVARGRGATVAVVDTGVYVGHEDLSGQVLPGRNFVDDGHAEDDPGDRNGHGTLIAGIIAARTDNALGVASTAPRARILPVRVLDANGEGTSSVVARGIDWAVEQGADVINLSLARDGSSDSLFLPELLLRDPGVDEAIRDAARAGAVVVIAAGNDDAGGKPETSYNATVDGVVVVGSSTTQDERAAHSNYGAGLDLLAPGGGSPTDPSTRGCTEENSIVSTWWDPDRPRRDDAYGGGCGTSMAVAFVSGVAAMLATRGKDNVRIVNEILRTADDLGPAGPDLETGYGRLNARRALGAAVEQPAPKRPPPVRPQVQEPFVGTGQAGGAPPPRDAPKKQAERGGAVLEIALPPVRPERPVTPAAALIALVVLGHSWRIITGTRR